jgi:hypothetical protein
MRVDARVSCVVSRRRRDRSRFQRAGPALDGHFRISFRVPCFDGCARPRASMEMGLADDACWTFSTAVDVRCLAKSAVLSFLYFVSIEIRGRNPSGSESALFPVQAPSLPLGFLPAVQPIWTSGLPFESGCAAEPSSRSFSTSFTNSSTISSPETRRIGTPFLNIIPTLRPNVMPSCES